MMTAVLSIESPRSIDEALNLLSTSDESVRPIAGGTGLGLLMKHGFFRPTMLVNLRHLASELADLKVTPDGALHLGSMITPPQPGGVPECTSSMPRCCARL